MNPPFILASNSPRRRQLLALTGWSFTVRPVDIDESPLPGELPDRYVLRLAESKARAAGEQSAPGEVILTADTTVADGAWILGKPADAAEAREMLRSLRGRAHAALTAIGVNSPSEGRLITDLCETQVWMRDYTDEEIEAYIATGDPFDKAGAYAIQNATFNPVERITGCYACVMGLPLCHVVRALAPFGFSTNSDIAASCPEALNTDSPCPITEKILRSGLLGAAGGIGLEESLE